MYYIDYIRSVLISHLVASNVCVWTSLDLWCQHFCMSCMVHVGSEAFWHSEDCGANPRLEGQSRPCAIESWVTKLEFFTELSKLGAHGDPHGWNFVLVSRSVKPPPNEPNFFWCARQEIPDMSEVGASESLWLLENVWNCVSIFQHVLLWLWQVDQRRSCSTSIDWKCHHTGCLIWNHSWHPLGIDSFDKFGNSIADCPSIWIYLY